MIQRLTRDFSFSAMVAGLIAITVGYSASAVIVFQASTAAHLSSGQTASWIWAISVGSGLTALVLSLKYRVPVITAWSTPGAALLVTGLPLYSFPEAVGAYLAAAVLVTVLGVTGVFSKVMEKIPGGIVAAMLGGILFQFGLDLFSAMHAEPALVLPVFIAYLVCRRWQPRYAVVAALVVGLALAFGLHEINVSVLQGSVTVPEFTVPRFSVGSLIGLGIPLALVAMTSQNAPGVGVLRTAGYDKVPVSPLVTFTGLVSVVLAPFGGHGITLAAITAAICTGPESHPDKDRRYIAGVTCGVFYIVAGIFGTAVTSVFTAFPPALISALAGVALLGALAGGMGGAMHDDKRRESALVTFLVTASGVTFFGIGAAFWGLVAGMLTHWVLYGNPTKRRV